MAQCSSAPPLLLQCASEMLSTHLPSSPVKPWVGRRQLSRAARPPALDSLFCKDRADPEPAAAPAPGDLWVPQPCRGHVPA